MDECLQKKKLIYEKLHNSVISDDIINLINGYNIPKTINKNGVFINISVLNDDLIQLFYEKIQQLDNNTNQDDSYTINITEYKEDDNKKDRKSTIKKMHVTKKKLLLTDLQKKILSFS